MARVAFALKMLGTYLRRQPRDCPYCRAAASELLGRKKLMLELRRCAGCGLMYRYPKNDPESSFSFYQRQYAQGMTTDLPDAATLAAWKTNVFRGTEKDLAEKIRLVQSQQASGRLLDYGCSWGYGVYQFAQAGFDAMGFEISRPRARFGRERLGVRILESREELEALRHGSFDVIFSNHVLEHLDDPRAALEDWARLLRPQGLLAIFVPNAGGVRARTLGPKWGPMIGEKHPLAIDALFLHRNLPAYGLKPGFTSSPYHVDGLHLVSEPASQDLGGDELLVFARRCGVAEGAVRH